MKQILQNLGTGETSLVEVPVPAPSAGCVLVRSHASLVSLGTERMLIDFGKSNLIEKARRQPDKVRQVLQKIQTDGLGPTLEAVRTKLDQPLALGYCQSGTVIALGRGVDDLRVGDLVATNGPHAEFVSVPRNLCARVPGGVSPDHAAFTPLAAIALQGIRLIEPTIGESVVVVGLGLVGLLAVQLLRANGCRVLGFDYDAAKCELARAMGAESVVLDEDSDPEAAASVFSKGRGVDAVVITASTKSSEPVSQAAHMCRKRGRIVLVGVTGLELSRSDFYEKELTFQVSCSYGPGRYEEAFEGKGFDYPLGFVRWTEQRNFEAVLDLMAAGSLDVEPLISHRYSIDEALEGYARIGESSTLGIVINYADRPQGTDRTVEISARRPAKKGVAAIVGAGNYAGATLLPALACSGLRLKTIVSKGGVTGSHLAKKFEIEHSTTDLEAVLADREIDTLIVSTQHNTHARMVLDGLKAEKHVFVEKPLCLTEEELEEIEAAVAPEGPILMVGFNRRFAPQVVRMRELLGSIQGPKALIVTVNAGMIPATHWTQDPERGGGRMIGEGCHFIDLMRFLSGSPIVALQASALHGGDQRPEENMAVSLQFGDGSIGTLHYLANGSKGFPKERVEVFAGGRVLQLDNFRRLTGFGFPKFRSMNLRHQDKGHAAELKAFADAVKLGAPSPISFGEIAEVTRVTFAISEQAR